MTIYRFGEESGLREKQDLALGTFDAFHKGHQRLLSYLTDGYRSLVSLFNPLPVQYFQKDFSGLVCTLEQRFKLLKDLQVAGILLVDFSYELSKMTGRDFLDIVCRCIPVRRIVVGLDFCMGYKRSFCVDSLRLWGASSGIDIDVIELIGFNGSKFSSGLVRKAILKGDFNEVERILGRPYVLDLDGLKFFDSGNDEYTTSLENVVQVLPCDGVYRIKGGHCVRLREHQLVTKSSLSGECLFEKRIE